MKLSPKQAKILSFTQLDSRLSAREIAAGTGLREHSIVFGLKSLIQSKLIRPFVMANLHGLGLTDYCIFLNYSGKGKGIRTKILKYCIASPQTAYVAELSGAFQVSVSLFARSIFEVEDFFSDLSDAIPEGALTMSFAIRSEWTVLARRYFDPSLKLPKSLKRGRMLDILIDEIDSNILRTLSEAPARSVGTMARELKLPETTFRHRVHSLEKSGLIIGYPYEIDTIRLGLSPIRLLILARDKSRRFRDELFKFVAAHPRASAFVRCLGAWDFEITYDLEDLHEGGTLVEETLDYFGDRILELQTMTELKTLKTHHFPAHL